MARKSKFIKYCKETSFHGFFDYQRAIKHAPWRGVFWIVVMVACFACAIYEIARVIIDFNESPIITSYNTESVKSLEFPPIQICLTNLVNKTRVEELKMHPSFANYAMASIGAASSEMKMYLDVAGLEAVLGIRLSVEVAGAMKRRTEREAYDEMILIRDQYGLPQEMIDGLFYKLKLELREIFPNTTIDPDIFLSHYEQVKGYLNDYGNIISHKLLEAIGIDTSKIFLSCEFANRDIDCESKIQSVFDSTYGRCFLLTTDQQQTLNGYGLSAVVKLNTKDAWHNIGTSDQGVYIRIEHQYSPASLRFLGVYPGTRAEIRITATHYQMWTSEHYGLCQRDMPNREVVTFPYTSSDVCRLECAHRFFMKKCGCTREVPREYIKDADTYVSCMEVGDIECLFSEGLDEDPVYEQCIKTCKPACEYWAYDAQISHTRFPSPFFQQVLSNVAIDPDEFAADHVFLKIAFNRLEHLKVTQKQALTRDGFIGQIGGHFGLFLGASVMTLIQTAAFIFNHICGGYKLDEQKKEKKKRNKINVDDRENIYSTSLSESQLSYQLPNLY